MLLLPLVVSPLSPRATQVFHLPLSDLLSNWSTFQSPALSFDPAALGGVILFLLEMKPLTLIFLFISDNFEKAKELLTKMRYFSNIEEKIKLKKIPL